jgi:hypothetical protein
MVNKGVFRSAFAIRRRVLAAPRFNATSEWISLGNLERMTNDE